MRTVVDLPFKNFRRCSSRPSSGAGRVFTRPPNIHVFISTDLPPVALQSDTAILTAIQRKKLEQYRETHRYSRVARNFERVYGNEGSRRTTVPDRQTALTEEQPTGDVRKRKAEVDIEDLREGEPGCKVVCRNRGEGSTSTRVADSAKSSLKRGPETGVRDLERNSSRGDGFNHENSSSAGIGASEVSKKYKRALEPEVESITACLKFLEIEDNKMDIDFGAELVDRGNTVLGNALG